MHKAENSIIPCFVKIDLNGNPTVGNLTEIKLDFRNPEITWKFNRNFNGNA